MTKYEIMTKIRSMHKEDVEKRLYDALKVLAAYADNEGYYPKTVPVEINNLQELIEMVEKI